MMSRWIFFISLFLHVGRSAAAFRGTNDAPHFLLSLFLISSFPVCSWSQDLETMSPSDTSTMMKTVSPSEDATVVVSQIQSAAISQPSELLMIMGTTTMPTISSTEGSLTSMSTTTSVAVNETTPPTQEDSTMATSQTTEMMMADMDTNPPTIQETMLNTNASATQSQQDTDAGMEVAATATAVPTEEDTDVVYTTMDPSMAVGETLTPTFTTTTTQLAMLPLADGDCSAESPCDMCIGDCNSDDDCQEGLECFRRTGNDVNPIPGCSGSGVPGRDYCYMPASNHLRLRDKPCTTDNPCEICEGDCDGDEHCSGDLLCYQVAGYVTANVPGCIGATSTGLDFCYNPNGCEVSTDCSDLQVCQANECVAVEPCGPNLCDVGEYCCNPSCGICAPMDGDCIDEVCEACGPILCQAGDICCNESCGICTPPRDSCTDEICAEVETTSPQLDKEEAPNRTRFLRRT